MLIQDYLRRGATLDDLTAQFGIKANVNAAGTLVCLNYSMFVSDLSEPICRECRALILEVGSWNVVSKSFDKFFNYGEPGAPEIDLRTARVQEKLDGSLISIYYYGEWRIASRGMCDASGRACDSGMTFRDLVLLAMADMGYTDGEFFGHLTPSMSYAFELTAPENRVVVDYRRRSLTLLAAWDVASLEELDLETLGLPFPTVRTLSLAAATFGDLTACAAELDPFVGEGYVVVDSARNRVKVKNPLYVAAAGLMAGLQSDRQIVDAAVNPSIDDLLPLVPAPMAGQIAEARDRFQRLLAWVLAEYDSIRHHESQRDFAQDALQLTWPAALFDLRKGLTTEDILRKMSGDAVYGVYCRFREREAAAPDD